MVEHLGAIAKKEHINISYNALLLVAQIAQGGLRDAESLLDQLSLLGGEITPDAVWDLVGTVPERDLLSLLEYISQGDVLSLLQNVRRILDRGREPLILLQNLAMIYRDLLIAKMTTEKGELISLSDQGWQKLQLLAQSFSSEQIITGQQQLRSAEVQIKNTTQPRLWLEVTLCELLGGLSKQEPVSSPQKVETNSSAAMHKMPPPAIPKNHDPVTLWQSILAKLSPPTKALFVSNLNAVISEVRDREILIGIADPKDDAKKKEKSEIAKQRRPEIETAAKEVLGKSMQIRYKFVAGLQPAEVNSVLPSSSHQNLIQESAIAKKGQSEIEPALPAIKPHFANTPEDIALKNIADLFSGQVIILDEETTDNLEN